jgi:hypothetical protein
MYRVVVHLSGLGRPNCMIFCRRSRDEAVRQAREISFNGFWARSGPATFIPPIRVVRVELRTMRSRILPTSVGVVEG